jgi:cytochrome b
MAGPGGDAAYLLGVTPGLAAVDLCCGDGTFTAALARLTGRTVHAIDIGPARLFHWSLVLVFAASCITAWRDQPDAHLLAGQAASGLAGRATGEPWLRGLHRDGADLLLGVVGLHLLVIIAYAALRGHDLVRPMITGKKRLPAATPAPGVTSPFLALAILALAAGAVWLLAARL